MKSQIDGKKFVIPIKDGEKKSDDDIKSSDSRNNNT